MVRSKFLALLLQPLPFFTVIVPVYVAVGAVCGMVMVMDDPEGKVSFVILVKAVLFQLML